MFREMRRKRQQLSSDECVAILEKMTHGTLALAGDGCYPYAVPVSYVYARGKIYIHSAPAGHKIDAIARDPRVSFCVVERDDVRPAEFTTYFRSVLLFGKARLLRDEDRVMEALLALGEKYAPGGLRDEINRGLPHLCIIEIDIEHLTGKQAIELLPSPAGRP